MGKIFKTIWVGLSVGKVRSDCVKLQRICLPSFVRLLVVGSVVLRLLVTLAVWFVADFEAISYQVITKFDKS